MNHVGNIESETIMTPTPTPTPLLLAWELWPVGPLRTQHVNFWEREMESFIEVQDTLLNSNRIIIIFKFKEQV